MELTAWAVDGLLPLARLACTDLRKLVLHLLDCMAGVGRAHHAKLGLQVIVQLVLVLLLLILVDSGQCFIR